MQRGARPEWRHAVAPETLPAVVSKWLCEHLGLDADQCQLYNQGRLLTDQPLKKVCKRSHARPLALPKPANLQHMKLRPLQVQQSACREIRITAAIETALSINLWQSLPSTVDRTVTEFWLEAAACIADRQHWPLLRLSSSKTLTDLVALPPGDQIPDGFQLTSCTDLSTSPDWAAISAPAKPLVLLIHTFLHMTALHDSGLPQDSCIKQELQRLNTQMQQLALRLESTAPAQHASTYIKHLRACFVLLKMLQLLTTIEIPDSPLEKVV